MKGLTSLKPDLFYNKAADTGKKASGLICPETIFEMALTLCVTENCEDSHT